MAGAEPSPPRSVTRGSHPGRGLSTRTPFLFHWRRDMTTILSYAISICETALLSDTEEHALAVRARAGDAAAREQLVRGNMRLVVAIARKFQRRDGELDDLVAAGNYGLVRAV